MGRILKLLIKVKQLKGGDSRDKDCNHGLEERH